MSAIIETSVGDLTIDLLIEERPKCCYNFLKLCKMKYYNFCGFHRLEKDFIAQTGDPTGTGKGGQSVFGFLDGQKSAKFFPREVIPKVNHTRLGTVSMVNNGDDMHGSQFFFTLRENLDYLDGVHTVFGYVVEGLETLTKMNELFFSDIIITHTIILADPFDDPPDLVKQFPDSSPEPSEEIIRRMCIAHNIDEKPAEDPKDQESKAAATILEMIGDLPSEDVKPPDNVLFVCKLNPVTKEEDLVVIFSRFGPISECEIIRDQKTGDSLQYAFIEFENVEDCEKAYFKMDNVLVDDRRIHVDFSQSVAKYKWNRKSDLKKNQGNRRARSVTKDGSPEKRLRKHETSPDRAYKTKQHERYSRDQRRDHKGYPENREMSKRNDYSKDEYRREEKDRDHDRDRYRENRRDDYRKRDSYRDRKYDKEESHQKRRDRSRSRDHHRDRERDRDRGYQKDRDRGDYVKDNRRDREKNREKDRERDRDRDRDRDRGKSNRT